MITLKASQKFSMYAEVSNLTGNCAEHLENFAKRSRLGFIARASEIRGHETDQWLFGPWYLMFLAVLFSRCSH